MLDIHRVTKRFGDLVANDAIDLTVEPGEICGVIGENGAGKSTLMKVLSGYIAPEEGAVTLDGTALPLGSPRASLRAGVGILHQEPLTFGPMTAIENVIVGSRYGLRDGARVSKRQVRTEIADLRDELGFGFDLDAPTALMGVGERQQLEITRLLWLGARVLILDEPTTAITADQRDILFATLKRLAAGEASGVSDDFTVLLVSHKLAEVAALCDQVAVLRKGELKGVRRLPCPEDELVGLMFGESVAYSSVESAVDTDAPPLLELRGATAAKARPPLASTSVQIAPGEVVGLAGLDGSGQRTMLKMCAGAEPMSGGELLLDASEIQSTSWRRRQKLGVVYLPADRGAEGLVPELTITEHLLLAEGEEGSALIDMAEARTRAVSLIERFRIAGTPESTPEELSGGNQQRLLLGLLEDDIRLLLMDQPTRGLDLGSAEWVWQSLLARRASGTALVFASADLDELLRYSDRILVFFEGSVLTELNPADLHDGDDTLGRAIGGLVVGP